MNNVLNTQFTVRQLIGATLVMLAGGYLLMQLVIMAINTSTYM